jgi:pimeloyl-ACP methyl ester carboxylesterase
VEEPARKAWSRRWRWLVAAAIALVAGLAIGVALSWHFSDQVLAPDHSNWSPQVQVEGLPPGRIVLERSEDTERPGVYALEWTGGRAIVGAVVDGDEETVTRRLRTRRGYLAPEMEVGVEPNVFGGDPGQAFGLPFKDVDVPDELGPMPAWLVPARARRDRAGASRDRETWAIVVHGINGTLQNGLRMVPTLHRARLPTLLISYREDLGAPESPDGLHHMGLTEWRDLAAAARYALDHGAKRLILAGYSMGGAIVAQFMERSPLASRVDGLVLDAPVLDWKETLELNTTREGWPSVAALPLEWAIDARIDADWDSLDAHQHLDDFRLPILLFHGEDDEVVPISGSQDFAAELPRRVTFYSAPKAGHCESWNVGPERYERRLSAFLARVLGRAEDAGHVRAQDRRAAFHGD